MLSCEWGERRGTNFISQQEADMCDTLHLAKTQQEGGMHILVCVSIQSLNQNWFLHITLLYKHKTVTSAAGGDV